MYRTHQSKAMTEETQAQLPQVHFIPRVVSLPAVSSAWVYAFNVYEKAKGYNPLVEMTLNKAESTAKAVVNQVVPITARFKVPIELMDSFACKGLDEIENKLPVITLPPEEILTSTKSYVNTKLEPAKNYGTEKMEQIKSTAAVVGHYGYSTANVVLGTKIGHYALDSVDAILNVAENYVDHYLPITDDGTDKKEESTVNSKELEPPVKVAYSVRRALKISQKTYKGALEKLHSAQLTTKALVQHLDLVQLAHHLNPSAVKEQAQVIWASLLKEEELKEGEKSSEQLSITIARQMAKRLVGVYSSAYTTFQGVPAHLQHGFEEALKQTEEVYTRIVKATHMEAFSDSMIGQLKATLNQLNKTLGGLQHLAATWLDGLLKKSPSQPRPDENGCKDPTNHQDVNKLD